jgi:nucleoside phosphorylase
MKEGGWVASTASRRAERLPHGARTIPATVTSRIPAYFCHSYRPEDREINKHFWQLFWDAGFAFTVDPRSGRLSIPHLELMLRRNACFVAVVTHRADVQRYLTSPYVVFEYGLAVQADMPGLVFLEDTVALSHFDEHRRILFNREALTDHDRRYIGAIRQLKTSIGRADADDLRRSTVGLLLPRTGAYVRAAPAIRRLLDRAGYSAEDIDCDAPNSYKVILDAKRHDFVVIDVGQGEVPEWLHAHLFGRVPMMRLVHHQPGGQQGRLPSLLLGHAIELVARSDELAIWWNSVEDLIPQLDREVSRLRSPPRGMFRTLDQGIGYFNSLGRSVDATVFISNANAANDFALRLCDRFDTNYIRYFHYVEQNPIELGSLWRDGLHAQLKSSQLFVPLITRSYWDSDVCKDEYRLAQEMSMAGQLRIFPYFLDDMLGGPPVALQGRRLHGLALDQQLDQIVQDVDRYLTPDTIQPQASRTWWQDDSIPQVDVAFVTILPEEYDAVLRHLDWHHAVPSTHVLHNRYGWQFGEITPLDGERPYRVVLGLAGQKGTSAGLMIVGNTIETFRPEYVLLVGIAGGLGKANKGDVVVADRIYGYEYGMIAGGFWPRPDWNHPTDTGVVNKALVMASAQPGWHDTVNRGAVVKAWPPRIHVGPVASGNKVIEDLSDASFKPVLEYWPNLIAIEMEALGASEAIRDARESGYVVNFAMIRGISDRPSPRSSERGTGSMVSKKTRERYRWKSAAAEVAAACAVQMVRLAWPRPPRTFRSRPATILQSRSTGETNSASSSMVRIVD